MTGVPTVHDAVDQVEHVTTAKLADGPISPRRDQFALDDAPHNGERSVLGLIALEPLGRDSREGVFDGRW